MTKNKIDLGKIVSTIREGVIDFYDKNVESNLKKLNIPTKVELEKKYKEITQKYEKEIKSLTGKYVKEIDHIKKAVENFTGRKINIPFLSGEKCDVSKKEVVKNIKAKTTQKKSVQKAKHATNTENLTKNVTKNV